MIAPVIIGARHVPWSVQVSLYAGVGAVVDGDGYPRRLSRQAGLGQINVIYSRCCVSFLDFAFTYKTSV